MALMEKSRREKSWNFMLRFIEQNPFCIDAFKERGALKLSLGDKEGAEEDMRQVLEFESKGTKRYKWRVYCRGNRKHTAEG